MIFCTTHFEERTAKFVAFYIVSGFKFLRNFINGELRPKHKWLSVFYMHRKNGLVSKNFFPKLDLFWSDYFFICHKKRSLIDNTLSMFLA